MKRRPPFTSLLFQGVLRPEAAAASAAPASSLVVASGGGGGAADNTGANSSSLSLSSSSSEPKDTWNYALLVALYTLQGIPMGLSASIPFLIQQKVKQLSSATTSASEAYNAQAIFALCSWPFSLKLLWAPLVDAVFLRRYGRRKSWLVPVQAMAGLLMVAGSTYVERQLGLGTTTTTTAAAAAAASSAAAQEEQVQVQAARNLMKQEESMEPTPFSSSSSSSSLAAAAAAAAATAAPAAAASTASSTFSVKGVTLFFFVLYFLMATQDIAVDGWALTLLQKKNRGRGPICNSIGQNLGYFVSFVGFLALQDADTCERLWRPLFGLASNPSVGLVSLQSFLRFMGVVMLALTTLVALFKHEVDPVADAAVNNTTTNNNKKKKKKKRRGRRKMANEDDDDDDAELDASRIGLAETYRRLWAVCQLSSVRWLFLVLLTYRFPTALSDNVRFLKAVDWGLDKQVTALLSPILILPLGIAVPLVAARVWHGHPLRQFMSAYQVRVTLVPLLDVCMLYAVKHYKEEAKTGGPWWIMWLTLVTSTALQTIVFSLQFNAQMVFFAHRVDPAIGGSYMTLLNTAANLGGTWPASVVLYLVGHLTTPPTCQTDLETGVQHCSGGRDGYVPLQLVLSLLGLLWIGSMRRVVQHLGQLGPQAWKTNIANGGDDEDDNDNEEEEEEEGRARNTWQEKKRD